MLGLLVFAIGFAGFGRLVPLMSLDGSRLYSFRYFCGGILFIFTFYFLHVILHLDLEVSAWSVMAASTFGIAWSLAEYLRQPERSIKQWAHPIPLLILVGTVCILINDGIDYLPYSDDEFSNWIGVSRQIYLAGDYGSIGSQLWLHGYTPGWRLMLLYPWVLGGSISEGNSAAAPFIIMVGLAGILFDVARWRMRSLPGVSEMRSAVLAWALTLIALTAQVAGPTWMWNLLIEQPQIYPLAVSAVALSLVSFARNNSHILVFYAGLSLAGSYMLKAAALAFAPSTGLAIIILSYASSNSWSEFSRRVGVFATLVFLPIIVCMISWMWYTRSFPPGHLSVFQTFTADYIAHAQTLDWRDLAHRFSNAVWAYTTTYKLPLTILALLALLTAAIRGRIAPLVQWVSFFGLYTLSLYWYHLGGFGTYYFNTLNSIERFMRIPIHILHTLGFVVAIFEISDILARKRFSKLIKFLNGRTVGYLSALIVIVLGSYQTIQILRSVEDVSTRSYQKTDPNINEAKRAVEAAIQLSGDKLPNNPIVLFISQGTNAGALGYAKYFSLGAQDQDGHPINLQFQGVSWTPNTPVNVWQHKITAEEMRLQMLSSDMIWPMKVDPWILSILKPLVTEPACLENPLDKFFIRQEKRGSYSGFVCISKSG